MNWRIFLNEKGACYASQGVDNSAPYGCIDAENIQANESSCGIYSNEAKGKNHIGMPAIQNDCILKIEPIKN